MKKFLLILLIFFYSHCSFDNKSGIWTNNSKVDKEKVDRFKDFETLYTKEKSFDKVFLPKNNLNLLLEPIKKSKKWQDEFYSETNNLNNFEFKNFNKVIFKSIKLSRHKTSEKALFDGDKFIISDIKGNIIVYSISENKIILKFNFYKNKFKKLKKSINIFIENNILYVSDNLGYLYAINYNEGKLLWAKNFKIPFRSNIKIVENKIITADQDNTLYILNKFNGTQIKFIPTEGTTIKNNFVNSLASKSNSIFFLNTFGSIYSINRDNLKVNWFSNLKDTFDLNPTNLFFSNPIVINNDKIVVSTDPYLYILNFKNGAITLRMPITSIVQPIISGEYLFIITKDNLLVCLNVNTNKLIYSVDISQEIADFLDVKKKLIDIKYFSLANNNLLIFLNNSYLVTFNKNAKIEKIEKLKNKLATSPIYINKSMLFLNKQNKMIMLN